MTTTEELKAMIIELQEEVKNIKNELANQKKVPLVRPQFQPKPWSKQTSSKKCVDCGDDCQYLRCLPCYKNHQNSEKSKECLL